MSAIEAALRVLAEHGDDATLARESEGTTISLKAKRFGQGLEDIGNSAAQQRFRVKIGTTELAASAWSVKVPKRFDTLTIDGKVCNVMDARPLKDGTTTALYELEVVG